MDCSIGNDPLQKVSVKTVALHEKEKEKKKEKKKKDLCCFCHVFVPTKRKDVEKKNIMGHFSVAPPLYHDWLLQAESFSPVGDGLQLALESRLI